MKNFVWACMFLLPFIVTAQSFHVESKTVSLVEERVITLNSGTRAALGGKSRTTIKIDLPPGTKQWYYSITTTPGPDATNTLNLALQLSGLLTSGGTTLLSTQAVKIPPGSATLDVYLLDAQNVIPFEHKVDRNGGTFYAKREGTIENTKQGIVRIDDFRSGTWYIGLKNPSEMNAINIHLEVVAIVEEKVAINKTVEQQKSELLGTIGWKAYEKGDYVKSLQLSHQAVAIDSTAGWIWNNIGLVQLVNGELANAIDSYAKAIYYVKKSPYAKRTFAAMMKDLQDLINAKDEREGAAEMLEQIRTEYINTPNENAAGFN
jgi:hypothetical protein